MKPLILLFLCFSVVRLNAQTTTPLKLIQTIPLPGVRGRFDHCAADPKGHRLFVAALGNNTLEVLDVAAGKRLKSIAGLRKPTGVVYLPEANQLGVANGDDGAFKLFDAVSYGLAGSVRGLEDADNVRRDAKTGFIYVGYGAGALAILDRAGQKRLGEIKLSAHPESFQLETAGPRIFVNVPDAKQVAMIDRETRSVVGTWPSGIFQGNFPMALDEAGHRLFVGCRQPPRLAVLSTETTKLVADREISADTDDLFFDGKRQRLYLSCGEGFLDVIQCGAEERYERIAREPTRAGARTCFYSPDLDRLYLAVPQRGGEDAELRIYEPE